jgi:hypothetical protein
LRYKGTLALAAIAALILGVATAVAAQSHATKLHFFGNAGHGDDQTLFGDLESNSKCLANRKVKMSKKVGGEFRLVDVDRSSRSGAWATRGNLAGTPDVLIRVTKDTRKSGRVICKPDGIVLSASKKESYR